MANSYTETSNTPSEITNVLTESSIHDESGENSENFHSQSGPVEAINEDELENETHEQVCDFAADDGSDKMNNEAIAAEFFEEYVSNEGDQHTEPSQGPNDQHSVRKSSRSRRPRQISPESGERSNVAKRPRTSALPKTVRAKKKMDAPFKCDLCGSQHITDPSRRGNRPKTSAHAPSPRHKLDPESGRMLTLCNACGLSFNRPKAPRHRAVCDQQAKRSYLEEASQFAASLAEGLEEPDASRLYCPQYKTSACACLQKYILAEGNIDESRQRAQQLLSLLKQSQILSKQKCYNNDETENLSVERKGKRGKAIGLGNGQRKSKEFETFVLEQRKYLREDLKLCEQATQRVLCYSNNFLHKKLKTDPTKPLRVKRQKGQAVLGKLKSIDELAKETCCVDKCVSMAQTHSKLLQQWRERSATGQAEARRVLAEMLTPSGGARSNCYKFISWVTGCSHSTIGRVNDQMKKTGGDREPPVHGLINWWKDHPKPKKVKPKPVPHNPATHGVQIHHFANAQLQALQQLGILQPANVAIQGTLLSGQNNPQVITINPSLGLNIPTSTQTQGSNRQVVLTPTQHTQLQLQQIQQQQQQLQLQTMQLQQQLQQQLQHEQQLHTQNTDQNQSIILPSQVISTPDAPCLTITQSHDFSQGPFTNALHPPPQVETVCPSNGSLAGSSQSTTLSTDTFLASETLQILNAGQVQTVAPHVVTLQCSSEPSTTQAVPVSLIQTPVTLSL